MGSVTGPRVPGAPAVPAALFSQSLIRAPPNSLRPRVGGLGHQGVLPTGRPRPDPRQETLIKRGERASARAAPKQDICKLFFLYHCPEADCLL